MKTPIHPPKYRIVADAYAGYEVQRKLWWWPFWHQPRTNTRCTIKDAEQWLVDYLNRPPSGTIIKEIKLP